MSDESQLIDQALRGDRAAFTMLVRRHQERLFASMLQVTGSADEAEDVVQDAFIRAFLKLDTFQQNSQFFTWLYRIAFNSALSRRRRKRPNVSLEHYREMTGDDIQSDTAGVDESMLRGETVDLVQTAISQLTENHRRVLVLREMDEMSYEQIAEILEISIGTVRSRLNRARGQLKQTIEAIRAARDDKNSSLTASTDRRPAD
ncbi:MAG: sigma-70 family RNA polymerase sigma factor [Planctomycetota bacterium]